MSWSLPEMPSTTRTPFQWPFAQFVVTLVPLQTGDADVVPAMSPFPIPPLNVAESVFVLQSATQSRAPDVGNVALLQSLPVNGNRSAPGAETVPLLSAG